MQLVIKVDLDKARQSLAEVFRLIGNTRWAEDAAKGPTADAGGLIKDERSNAIGKWEVEETEGRAHPLESAYRAAAMMKYVQPKQIEVDRFAAVSQADGGAYVQGWLFVPRADVEAAAPEPTMGRKPPQSEGSAGARGIKAG